MPKVLIADDALIIRMQIKNFFENTLNWEQVWLAEDGNQAVELYKEHKPDLTTLDLTMPNKDGIEALSEIIDHNPSAKVIVVSAIKDADKITSALEIGAAGYIKKPLAFKNEEFVASFKEEIEDVLEEN